MTPKTKREQEAGKFAVWRAEIEELTPIEILKLKKGKITIRFTVYVANEDVPNFLKERHNDPK